MCIIPEMYRVEIFYFCLIVSLAVTLILLSCTFSEAANLPDFIVETWVFGCIKVNPMTLLFYGFHRSVVKDAVLCYDPVCWVSYSWAFKRCANFMFMHSMSLENSGYTYSACRM
jgi:hypothetical protein